MSTGTLIPVLALLLAPVSLAAGRDVYLVKAPELTVIGFHADSASSVAADLTRHRKFLETQVPAFSTRRLPLTVVEVCDADFASFGLGANVPSFFVQSGLEGLVAVREPMERHRDALLHEVFHAVARQTGWSVQQGLEEGLAEYFATASYDEHGRVTLGVAQAERLRRLAAAPATPVSAALAWHSADGHAIVAGSRESTVAYDLDWAAAHWLLHASGASLSDAGVWLTPAPEMLRRLERELPKYLKTGMTKTAQRNVVLDSTEPVPTLAAAGLREAALVRILMQCDQTTQATRVAAEIRAGPEQGAVHAALGRLALRVGHYEEAATELARATEMGVDDASTWRNLALCQSRLNRHAATAASLKHVLALNPADDEARLVRASLLFHLDQVDEGLAEFRLISQAPSGREAEYAQLLVQVRALEARRGALVARRAIAVSTR